jgi:UDP-2,3-diacylglucosamine hydrolase
VTTLFISDLHLSAREAGTTRLFLDFLAGPARDAASLYILGDLFDYWLGDDALQLPFEQEIAGAIAGLAATGTTVSFMAGNRDFLVGPDLLSAAGMRGLDDPSHADIAGTQCLLMHGDTLCTDDIAYAHFRRQVRQPEWQRHFLGQTLTVRQQVAEDLRTRSEGAKQDKTEALMDVNDGAVAAAFRDHGVSVLVHGHVHRQGSHEHLVDGRLCHRWVLGAWGATASYLCCDGRDWHFGP